jgi:type I restriction enzyme S subunit
MPMICSSVNLVRFIVRPLVGPDSNRIWRKYPVAGHTASGPDLMLDFFEQDGDAIIISAVGSRCGKSFRARGKWSAIANTHVLRCREGLDVDFAFIFMNDEDFWLKGGTGQPFVLVRRTLERPLLLPPVNEQQAIASVLRDMDAEIQTLESRLAKARAVKEGMMQNLLTGRVRLV